MRRKEEEGGGRRRGKWAYVEKDNTTMWYRLSSHLLNFFDKIKLYTLKYKYNTLCVFQTAHTIFCEPFFILQKWSNILFFTATMWYLPGCLERTPWKATSSPESEFTWRKPSESWPSYWVFRLRPSRVSSRDGGTYPFTLSGRSCLSCP